MYVSVLQKRINQLQKYTCIVILNGNNGSASRSQLYLRRYNIHIEVLASLECVIIQYRNVCTGPLFIGCKCDSEWSWFIVNTSCMHVRDVGTRDMLEHMNSTQQKGHSNMHRHTHLQANT